MPLSDAELQTLAINTVRTLSMDAVQAADSGHPGTPMALAPLAYALYTRHVRHNPADPHVGKAGTKMFNEEDPPHKENWIPEAKQLQAMDL